MLCSPVQADWVNQNCGHLTYSTTAWWMLPHQSSDSSIGLLWLFKEHHKAREISLVASYQLSPSASPYPSKDPISQYHLNLWGMFICLCFETPLI